MSLHLTALPASAGKVPSAPAALQRQVSSGVGLCLVPSLAITSQCFANWLKYMGFVVISLRKLGQKYASKSES
jgi:hypothetical protein